MVSGTVHFLLESGNSKWKDPQKGILYIARTIHRACTGDLLYFFQPHKVMNIHKCTKQHGYLYFPSHWGTLFYPVTIRACLQKLLNTQPGKWSCLESIHLYKESQIATCHYNPIPHWRTGLVASAADTVSCMLVGCRDKKLASRGKKRKYIPSWLLPGLL